MPDVEYVIRKMNVIVNAQYMGSPSAGPKMHKLNFDKIQGSAEHIATVLTQNPKPNRDQQENLATQFKFMDKAVALYCAQTDGTDDVNEAFEKASKEWGKLIKKWNK